MRKNRPTRADIRMWKLRRWLYRKLFNIKKCVERRVAPRTVEEFMDLPEDERCVMITPKMFTDICSRIQALEAKDQHGD